MKSKGNCGYVGRVTCEPTVGDCAINLTAVIRPPSGTSIEEVCTTAWYALDKALGAKLGIRPVRILCDGPATILFWSDGEKTVVKCRECEMSGKKDGCATVRLFDDSPCRRHYDHEKAVMAAMLKRLVPGWQDDIREIEKEGN